MYKGIEQRKTIPQDNAAYKAYRAINARRLVSKSSQLVADKGPADKITQHIVRVHAQVTVIPKNLRRTNIS